jgi:hypothetical protein
MTDHTSDSVEASGQTRPKGPYFLAAAYCERALQEADGTVTLVRVIDRVVLTPMTSDETATPSPERPAMVNLTIALLLKTGDAPGVYTARFDLENPDGKVTTIGQPIDVTLADGGGMNVLINSFIQVQRVGPFLTHVYLNDEHFTQIPLEIQFLPGQPAALPST